MHGLLQEIGIAIVAATVTGVITHRLKQPIILGYLIAGAIIGPQLGFGFVSSPETIEILSEIGLILLLFVIGLEMDLKTIVSSGRLLIISGIGQFILCVLMGLLVFPLIGYGINSGNLAGFYLAIGCALSSTALVVKILYDKMELDCLPGKMTLGILIMQDVWAILILAVQPSFMNPQFSFIAFALLKSGLLLVIGFVLSRYVLKNICAMVASSPEMIVVISIGWCALIAGTAGYLGLSKEMGALIAGVAISTFPYSVHVTAKTLPLRDFFLTLFFISLGMKITPLGPMVILMGFAITAFIIITRFASVYPLLMLTGSGKRTSFIASLNLSQMSEFALVIAALGITYEHISKDIMGVVIITMAISAILSSYLIKYSHELYLGFERIFQTCPPGQGAGSENVCTIPESYPIIILGYHRGAQALVAELSKVKPEILRSILVVDFHLENLKKIQQAGLKGLFGDIASTNTLEHAHIKDAKVVLSTIPDMLLKGVTNMELVKNCRFLAPDSFILATADSTEHALKLREAGASDVIVPYHLTGEIIAALVHEKYVSL